MLFTKLLANRLFLLFISLVVTGIIGTLMVHELELMFSELSHETLAQLKEDEEGIAILLVGFGVLLEGRHILQNWIAGHEVEATETTHLCEYYGFILLALGLFIEIFDQITNLIHSPLVVFWTEVLVNYPINLYAMFLLFKIIVALANPQADAKLAH
ncbi:hypothetical protein [Pseudoalteromonas phenolica]|uniref:hypothetical protein n=1 Tax=Pseudoalteromonas phenolica TaxID=161398 RepID=UPI00110BF00B|nr:hypothetical protein [Pseudoalteromonas phenolica]TMO55316.1 hypothetical protein CWC21_11565 [Pseudoalteromonas phenolica]